VFRAFALLIGLVFERATRGGKSAPNLETAAGNRVATLFGVRRRWAIGFCWWLAHIGSKPFRWAAAGAEGANWLAGDILIIRQPARHML